MKLAIVRLREAVLLLGTKPVVPSYVPGNEMRGDSHSPFPSTTLTYLLIGRFVSLSTRPLGHLISTLSIFGAWPMPRISRGSCVARKLPPLVFSRRCFTPPASQVMIAPTAAGLLRVATS